MEFESLLDVLRRVDHQRDETEGEAAENDKEVGDRHLIGPIILAVFPVIKISRLHPSKYLGSVTYSTHRHIPTHRPVPDVTGRSRGP